MKRIVITAAALLALTIAIPTAASASVKGCSVPPSWAQGIAVPRNHPELIGRVSVRNMTCSTGLRAIGRSRLLYSSGNISTPGFYCYTLKVYQSGGVVLGANVRCVSGARALRFSWVT
jgi:hypothetical protein